MSCHQMIICAFSELHHQIATQKRCKVIDKMKRLWFVSFNGMEQLALIMTGVRQLIK